jgi:lipopolysaccharide/colanic/teichoic acid biosynthesis glycosyltransferase
MQSSQPSQPANEKEMALAARFLVIPSHSPQRRRKKLESAAAFVGLSLPVSAFRQSVVQTVHAQPQAVLLKRTIDLVSATLGLIAFSPLMVLIAGLIKVNSRGPVFYSAPRAGKNGRIFTCLKFRTMIQNAECMKAALKSQNERIGAFFKMSEDPRVTGIGKILRRYSLDELPQLWNVLLGEMSLVGPRPHPLDDFESYVPLDFRRLDVTPGITGLWQVTARRDPSFQRNMALDLEYIERWSLAMDMKILYKTIFAVIRGTGA